MKFSDMKIGVMILLTLSFWVAEIAPVSSSQTNENAKEELYVATYFVSSYGAINTMMVFDFNNVTGLPVDMSLPAFKELRTAKFIAPQLWQWYALWFSASFAPISLELANEYADDICKEFLKAFDLNLSIIDRNYEVNNETGVIETYRKLEAARYDIQTTEKLLKHKPTIGFGNLITRDFLSRYVKAYSTSALTVVRWYIVRSSNDYFWRLQLEALANISEESENGEEMELNLNEMLNNSEPIPIGQNSKILIEVDKGEEFENVTYSLNVVDIFPHGYIKEDGKGWGGDTILITYAPPANSVQNIIVTLRINKEKPSLFDTSDIAGLTALGILCVFTTFHGIVDLRKFKLKSIILMSTFLWFLLIGQLLMVMDYIVYALILIIFDVGIVFLFLPTMSAERNRMKSVIRLLKKTPLKDRLLGRYPRDLPVADLPPPTLPQTPLMAYGGMILLFCNGLLNLVYGVTYMAFRWPLSTPWYLQWLYQYLFPMGDPAWMIFYAIVLFAAIVLVYREHYVAGGLVGLIFGYLTMFSSFSGFVLISRAIFVSVGTTIPPGPSGLIVGLTGMVGGFLALLQNWKQP